jgi:hypothetical protein
VLTTAATPPASLEETRLLISSTVLREGFCLFVKRPHTSGKMFAMFNMHRVGSTKKTRIFSAPTAVVKATTLYGPPRVNSYDCQSTRDVK